MIDTEILTGLMGSKPVYYVYDTGRPATAEFCLVPECYDTYEFESFYEAEDYVADWLGDVFWPGFGVVELDKPYEYGGYGDWIMISSVRVPEIEEKCG